MDVFKRAFKEFLADDCMGLAQQIAFSSLLAFFPAMILLIGLLGLIGAYDDLKEFLGVVAPGAVIEAIDIAQESAAGQDTATSFAVLFGGFGAIWAASGDQRAWKWVTPGSIVGAVLWLALSGLFALYTSFSDSYDKTYGSLAGGIILLLWLNYSAFALLFGAELNSELDRQADIRTGGGDKAGLVRPARRSA